jgi:deoxyribose-phosphate aldolase
MSKTTPADIRRLADEFLHHKPAFQLPPGHPDNRSFAAWIDHTLLKPEAEPSQIRHLCEEARKYHFASVCVNPLYTALVAESLLGSGVLTCVVTGFPLGATPTRIKVAEARACLEMGAQEVDMVIPVGLLRAGDVEAVYDDVLAVCEAVHGQGAKLKVIIENAFLDELGKIRGSLISQAVGADFVKTSTGFAPTGATLADVELMRRVVGPTMDIKAAGGVRSLADARAFLAAGATRLGSSSGVKIMQELENESR